MVPYPVSTEVVQALSLFGSLWGERKKPRLSEPGPSALVFGNQIVQAYRQSRALRRVRGPQRQVPAQLLPKATGRKSRTVLIHSGRRSSICLPLLSPFRIADLISAPPEISPSSRTTERSPCVYRTRWLNTQATSKTSCLKRISCGNGDLAKLSSCPGSI